MLTFRLSGTAYIPDVDIADRLLRQASGTGATTGWTLTAANGDELETYDAAGKLLSLANRAGQTQTFTYDGSGRLATISDPYGRTLTLAYDAQNRVATLAQPDGGLIAFAYDAANNLSGITWPDTRTRAYHYENASFPNNLTGLTDENGARYATWGYDSQGRAVSSQHAGGADLGTLSYGATSTSVTDALGTVRTLNLATVLGVQKSTGSSQPGGSGCGPASSAIAYDGNGNVASRTDFNGNVTTFSYDLARNLEARRIEAAGTPEQRTTSTQWHATYRLPVKVAEPKKLTTYSYDSAGNLLSRTEQATSDATGGQGLTPTLIGTPRTWAWTYNAFGQTLTADGPRTDVTDLTTFTYYPANDPDLGKRGNLASVTNALGHVTQITAYDANGRPLSVIDPNGTLTTLAYDARGRLIRKTVSGETTAYQYDGVGQLTRVTLADGSYLAYTYDGAHRLTGLTDALGNTNLYTLDALGNRIREDVKDPLGQLARTRSRVFDALSRLSQDIGAQSQTTQYAYDANGNLTSVTDPLNRTTANVWDALNRLVRSTDPAAGQTRYAYDGQGQLVAVSDPRNLATTYTIDGLGNRSQLTSPDTGVSQSSFDAAGNLLTRTDAKGQTTTWQYDALNRVILVSYADGQQIRTTWDQGPNGIGRPGLVEEFANGVVTAATQIAYDALGRVVSETRSAGSLNQTTGYQYASGQLAAMIYPSGKRLDYSRDGMGRINAIQLTDNGTVKTLASAIAYQPFGGVQSWTNGAGQTSVRSTDQDGRIVGYTLGNSTWQIGYDAASRILYQTDTGNAASTVSYGYDALDRLTAAVLPTTSLGYGYDATGNRSSQTSGSSTKGYQTSPTSNRLLGVDTAPPTVNSFDANGSLTGDGTRSFAYDARGRLTQATTAAGSTSYRIDAFGRRVAKTNATEDTRYTYDREGHLIAESDAQGRPKREVIWLGDTPIAVLQ